MKAIVAEASRPLTSRPLTSRPIQAPKPLIPAPRPLPRLITSLHPMEQKAILAFTEQAVLHHGASISSISLYGTGQRTSRGFEDIEILVLTPGEDPKLEDAMLDTVAEIVVDTGVYLTVKCFSQAQFKAFTRAGVPMMRRIMDNRISLFES